MRRGGWLIGLVITACGAERSPDPGVHDLAHGETPIGFHCMERKGHPREWRSTPWRAEGCDLAALRWLALDRPPPTFHVTPECGNRLVHVTSENFKVDRVRPLDGDGRFEANLYFDGTFNRRDSRGKPCAVYFRATLRGRIDCAAGGAELEASWEEVPRMDRNFVCPSTLPCKFKTLASFGC